MIRVIRKRAPRYYATVLRQPITIGATSEDRMYGAVGDVLLINLEEGVMHVEKDSHVKQYYEEVPNASDNR